MDYSYRTLSGISLFVGMFIVIMGLNVAEQLYPGYSVSLNYISDLGATCRGIDCQIFQPSATIFNSAIFLAGILVIIAAYSIFLEFRIKVFPAFLAIAGIGAMGVGLFPEYTFYVHYLAAFITFISGGLSAIAAYPIEKPPLSYLSFLMGIVTLTALALLYFHQDLGLGAGGIERLIVFPFIIWALSFSGYLMQSQ